VTLRDTMAEDVAAIIGNASELGVTATIGGSDYVVLLSAPNLAGDLLGVEMRSQDREITMTAADATTTAIAIGDTVTIGGVVYVVEAVYADGLTSVRVQLVRQV